MKGDAIIGLRRISGIVVGILIVLVTGTASQQIRGDDTQEDLFIENFFNDFSHIGESIEVARFVESVSSVSLPYVDFETGEGKPILNQ